MTIKRRLGRGVGAVERRPPRLSFAYWDKTLLNASGVLHCVYRLDPPYRDERGRDHARVSVISSPQRRFGPVKHPASFVYPVAPDDSISTECLAHSMKARHDSALRKIGYTLKGSSCPKDLQEIISSPSDLLKRFRLKLLKNPDFW